MYDTLTQLCNVYAKSLERPIFLLTVSILLSLASSHSFAEETSSRSIEATSCFIRTYEAAEIPALERGLITKVAFDQGEIVKAGTVIAILDDAEAKIAVAIAEVELNLASKRLSESYSLQIAEAKVKETEQLIAQSLIEQEIASKAASSIVSILQARKALATTQADLDRANNARKEFAGSVSDAELSRLTYLRDRSQLDIESAEEDRVIAQLQIDVERSSVATAEAILERLRHERSQKATDQAIEKIDYERLTLQLQRARTLLQRRTIVAPFTGMLVEQHRHRGEWMEPGQPIFRLVRLDRLVVEGYANADEVHHSMRGSEVLVKPITGNSAHTVRGQLSFVSPEIDPVNRQVQIRAIVDNTQGLLRSGQAVEMSISVP